MLGFFIGTLILVLQGLCDKAFHIYCLFMGIIGLVRVEFFDVFRLVGLVLLFWC